MTDDVGDRYRKRPSNFWSPRPRMYLSSRSVAATNAHAPVTTAYAGASNFFSGLMRSKTRLLISNSSIYYDGFINIWWVVSPGVIKCNVYDKIEDDYGSRQAIRISNNRVRRPIKIFFSGLMRSKTRLLISNSSIRYDRFIDKWRVVSPGVIKGNVYDKIEDDYGSRQAIRISDIEFKNLHL